MSANCWEIKKCGREPGGLNEPELGVCPAAIMNIMDGLNNGHNGGRVCWAIAGTFCTGEVEGVFAKEMSSCVQCELYQLVTTEEGFDFVPTKEILKILND